MDQSQESTGNYRYVSDENVSPVSREEIGKASGRKSKFRKTPWHEACPDILEFFTVSYTDGEGTPHFKSGHPQYACIECKKSMKAWDGRILKHINDCLHIPDDNENLQMVKLKLTEKNDKFAVGKRLKYCETYVKLIAKYAMPFNILNDPLLWQLLELHNHEWRPPSAEDARSVLLPTMGTKERIVLRDKIKNQRTQTVAIQIDHWTELSKGNWLGVTATLSGGRCELICLVDVSAIGQAAATTLGVLIDKLQHFEAAAFNVIMSDASSACLLACRSFTEEDRYKHVYPMRCFAHFLNKVIERIKNHEAISSLLSELSYLTNMVSRSAFLRSQVQDSYGTIPQRITPTRWYSCIENIRTGISAIRTLRSCFQSDSERMSELVKMNPRLMSIVNDDNLLSELESLLPILEPLNYCIAISERSDGTLSEAVRCLFEYIRSLFKCDFSEHKYVKIAVCAVLDYLSEKHLTEEHFDLLLAAMALDRRYNASYFTIEGCVRVSQCFYKMAERSDIDTMTINESLMTYINQRGEFQVSAPSDMRPDLWWSLRSDSGFVRLARRIVSCPSSTANTERLFSKLKHGQGMFKTSFNLRAFENLTRIAMSLESDDKLETVEMELERATISFYQKANVSSDGTPGKALSIDESESRYNYEDIDSFNDHERNNLKSFCHLINFGIVKEYNPHSPVAKKREHRDLANEFRISLMTRATLDDISNLPSQSSDISTSVVRLDEDVAGLISQEN